MNANDVDKFYSDLSTACDVVGRPKLTQAAALLFFNRLSVYDYEWVSWGLSEATDHCKTGWELNVALIKSLIDSKQKLNKFRVEAIARLEAQDKASKDRDIYLESDEFKKNQSEGKKCFESLRELIEK